MPAWEWAEHRAILRCLLTGAVIEGRDKEKLYRMIREKTGMRDVFGFNSGREAIQAALTAHGVKGWQVIMPSYCCETVARAVIDSGARPLFCDICDDYNPDVDHILSLLNPSVKAIIFPHLFGNPGRIDALEDSLVERGFRPKILLIDDAAQSFGARLKGRLLGTFGDAGIISFGPGKTMTASGGGLLITYSDRLAKRIGKIPLDQVEMKEKIRRLLYWFFFRRWRRYSRPFFPLLGKLLVGTPLQNPRLMEMCNVDAAIALEQLRKLDRFLSIRINRKKILDGFLADFGWIDEKKEYEEIDSWSNVATKFTTRLNLKDYGAHFIEEYGRFLKYNGVEMLPLYTPIHMKNSNGSVIFSLKKTEQHWSQILQVPIEPSMSERDFSYVLRIVEKFIETAAS